MVVDMDISNIIERFGVAVALVIIFTFIATRFLNYLDAQREDEAKERELWSKVRESENTRWADMFTTQKIASDAQVMAIAELNKSIVEERTRSMAYQNTSTTALTELLTLVKELRGLPDGVRQANSTLGIIQKSQVGLTENEARRELEFKSELARMNNVMLGIQTAITKLEIAVTQLPMAVQKAVTPTFAPILKGLDELMVVAKDTQNKLIEKELSETIPTPSLGEGVVVETSEPIVDGA